MSFKHLVGKPNADKRKMQARNKKAYLEFSTNEYNEYVEEFFTDDKLKEIFEDKLPKGEFNDDFAKEIKDFKESLENPNGDVSGLVHVHIKLIKQAYEDYLKAFNEERTEEKEYHAQRFEKAHSDLLELVSRLFTAKHGDSSVKDIATNAGMTIPRWISSDIRKRYKDTKVDKCDADVRRRNYKLPLEELIKRTIGTGIYALINTKIGEIPASTLADRCFNAITEIIEQDILNSPFNNGLTRDIKIKIADKIIPIIIDAITSSLEGTQGVTFTKKLIDDATAVIDDCFTTEKLVLFVVGEKTMFFDAIMREIATIHKSKVNEVSYTDEFDQLIQILKDTAEFSKNLPPRHSERVDLYRKLTSAKNRKTASGSAQKEADQRNNSRDQNGKDSKSKNSNFSGVYTSSDVFVEDSIPKAMVIRQKTAEEIDQKNKEEVEEHKICPEHIVSRNSGHYVRRKQKTEPVLPDEDISTTETRAVVREVIIRETERDDLNAKIDEILKNLGI